MKILVFGMLAEDLGSHEITLDATDVKTLKASLLSRYPALKARQFRIAVNQEIAADDAPVRPGDEIALIPPFAGG